MPRYIVVPEPWVCSGSGRVSGFHLTGYAGWWSAFLNESDAVSAGSGGCTILDSRYKKSKEK